MIQFTILTILRVWGFLIGLALIIGSIGAYINTYHRIEPLLFLVGCLLIWMSRGLWRNHV